MTPDDPTPDADKDLPLKEDIRLLGRILSQTVLRADPRRLLGRKSRATYLNARDLGAVYLKQGNFRAAEDLLLDRAETVLDVRGDRQLVKRDINQLTMSVVFFCPKTTCTLC